MKKKNRNHWGIDGLDPNDPHAARQFVFATINPIYAPSDPDASIQDMPHYTDDRFKEAQTVWGRETKNLTYVYSDRVYQWDYKKSDESWEKASATGARPRTQRHYQEYLRFYYDAPNLELKHILAGFNLSNGYPYQVFGFKMNKPEAGQGDTK